MVRPRLFVEMDGSAGLVWGLDRFSWAMDAMDGQLMGFDDIG